MNAPTEITRESFNLTARDMMNFAVRIGLTDALGLALLVHNCGTNTAAIFAELDAYANADQHSNPARRNAWIKVRDAVRFFEQDDPTRADKFGFAAEARECSRKILTDAQVRI